VKFTGKKFNFMAPSTLEIGLLENCNTEKYFATISFLVKWDPYHKL
jgi:hypothetical protein